MSRSEEIRYTAWNSLNHGAIVVEALHPNFRIVSEHRSFDEACAVADRFNSDDRRRHDLLEIVRRTLALKVHPLVRNADGSYSVTPTAEEILAKFLQEEASGEEG